MNQHIQVERIKDGQDRRRTLYWRIVINGVAVGAARELDGWWRTTVYPPGANNYRLPFYASKATAVSAIVNRHAAVEAGERHLCCHNPSPGPHSPRCSHAFRLGLEIGRDDV